MTRQTDKRNNRRVSRRTLMKTTGFASASALGGLAGCLGGQGTSTPTTTGEIVPGERDFSGTTITWYDHQSPTIDAVKNAAKDWESATGGKVKFEVLGPNSVRDKQQTLFSSESGDMDIVGYPYQWGTAYTNGGHLADLTPYIERLHSSWEQDDYITAVWDAYGKFPATTDGGQYAIPTKFDIWIAFWNKNHFEEAGLDPETTPETWDDLDQMAETLDTDSHAGFDQSWLQPNSVPVNWLLMTSTKGGSLMDENGYPAFWLDAQRDTAVEAIEEWRRITDHSSDGFASMGFSETQSAFQNGQTSIINQWHAFAPGLLDSEESQVADSLGMGVTACGSANCNSLLGGWGAGISKYSDHKEAAFDFMAYANNPQNSLEGARNGMASSRASVLQDSQVQEAQPWSDVALEGLQEVVAQPKVVGWLANKPTISEFVQSALLDENMNMEERMREAAANVWENSKRAGNNPGETASKP